MIEELIAAASQASGLTPDKTRMALSAALALIQTHADPARLAALFDAVPGAAGLAEAGRGYTRASKGLLGGMMKTFGGHGGAAIADAMAMAQRMNELGVTNGRMKKMLPAAESWVQQKTGRDLLREALNSMPGVGPLLAKQAWAQG